jgi:hypothetical protein
MQTITEKDDELVAMIKNRCTHNDYESAHADADALVALTLSKEGYTKSAELYLELTGKWWYA